MTAERLSSELKVVLLALLLALVGALLPARTHAVRFADLRPLHLGTRCLIHHCDPYKATALDAEAGQEGVAGRLTEPEAPVYPPSTLLALMPLEPLAEELAAWVFTALTLLAAAYAGALMVASWPGERLLLPVLVVLFLSPPFTDALVFGNPALLAAALALLAILRPAGNSSWIPLAVALALKPQIAAPALLFLYLREPSRSSAKKAGVTFLILLAAGSAWTAYATRGFHFFTEIQTNVHLSGLPGHSTDPSAANEESFSFVNLQPLFTRIPHVSADWANIGAGLMVLVLIGVFLGLPSAKRSRPWTTLAVITLTLLLPVYHREYDRVIALLLIPATVELAGRFRAFYTAALVLWLTSDLILHHVFRRAEFFPWTPLLGLALLAILLADLSQPRPATPALIAS